MVLNHGVVMIYKLLELMFGIYCSEILRNFEIENVFAIPHFL